MFHFTDDHTFIAGAKGGDRTQSSAVLIAHRQVKKHVLDGMDMQALQALEDTWADAFKNTYGRTGIRRYSWRSGLSATAGRQLLMSEHTPSQIFNAARLFSELHDGVYFDTRAFGQGRHAEYGSRGIRLRKDFRHGFIDERKVLEVDEVDVEFDDIA